MTYTLLTVDLSTKTAWITDQTGRTLAAWSDVTRRTVTAPVEQAGWRMVTNWVLMSPPDGFWCHVTHDPELETPPCPST